MSIILLIKIILLYFLVAIIYYMMNKRRISDLSIMDLAVLFMLFGVISSMAISSLSLLDIILIMAILFFFHNIMKWLVRKTPTFKYVFECKPSLIISQGKLNYREMLKRRYKLDTLLFQLKESGIKKVEDVEYAILDSSGRISAHTYQHDENDLPLPIILDGQVQYVTLRLLHKDGNWLNNIIARENINLKNVFYAFYKQDKLYIIKNS